MVVDSLAYKMENLYVFPDKGLEMADYIRSQYKAGAYDGVNDARAFASMLTDDLVSVTEDLHIGVGYSPERIAMRKAQRENQDGNMYEFL